MLLANQIILSGEEFIGAFTNEVGIITPNSSETFVLNNKQIELVSGVNQFEFVTTTATAPQLPFKKGGTKDPAVN